MQVPAAIEADFHDWEGHCNDCEITRKYDPALSMCPAVTCSDAAAANAALAALAAASCDTTCTAACGANYQILRAYHDTCEEDEVPMAVEMGLHDYEEPCEDQNCNAFNNEGAEVCPHDHAHESCCEVAEEHGFEIDCTDSAGMMAAWTILTDACTTATCTSNTTCARAYAIVQSHHDYCLHDEVCA